MAYNTEPVSSVEDVRSKYAKYFESDDKSMVSRSEERRVGKECL